MRHAPESRQKARWTVRYGQKGRVRRRMHHRGGWHDTGRGAVRCGGQVRQAQGRAVGGAVLLWDRMGHSAPTLPVQRRSATQHRCVHLAALPGTPQRPRADNDCDCSQQWQQQSRFSCERPARQAGGQHRGALARPRSHGPGGYRLLPAAGPVPPLRRHCCAVCCTPCCVFAPTVLGSSRYTTFGEPMNAMATDSRRFMPPE